MFYKEHRRLIFEEFKCLFNHKILRLFVKHLIIQINFLNNNVRNQSIEHHFLNVEKFIYIDY